MKVILVVDGGVIQHVISDQDSLEVVVHDYDIEGYPEDELTTDASGHTVAKYDCVIDVNPVFIVRNM